MFRTFPVVLCCAFIVSSLSADASAVTITSNGFSLGFGATINTTVGNPGAWTTTETNAANTPVTAGNANATAIVVDTDFTLTPTVLGRNFSGAGPTFPGRVLTNGPGSDVSAWSNNFEATLTGVYSGPLPAGVINVQTTVNISQISIFAHAYNGGPYTTDVNNFHFNETTLGNMASSPNAATLISLGSSTGVASNYRPLVWNPTELAVSGFSATRNFNVTGFADGSIAYALDGFEIVGTIQVSYDFPAPEPSSLSLLSLGLVALARRRQLRAAV